MMPLNGPRAATPSSLPFMATTADLSAVIATESSGVRGWITDQDSLIAAFSRISVCIDFSFDFWRLQGIASRRTSTLNEAGGRSGDPGQIKERRPRAWHRLRRVTRDQSRLIQCR